MPSTSLLRCFFALYHEYGGDATAFPNLGSTFEAVEKAGVGPRTFAASFSIAPGSTVLVWDGTVGGTLRDWSAFVLRIRGSGTAHVNWFVDNVVSESDLSPGGAVEDVYTESLSCLLPLCKDNNRVLVNPVNADVLGLTGGVPTILSDAGTTLGKYFKCWATNPASAAASITLDHARAE